MNKIFRVIWSHATQSWVAVSELQSAKGKTKSSSTAKTAVAVVSAAAALVSGAASAATVQPGQYASDAQGANIYFNGTPKDQSKLILGKNTVGNPLSGAKAVDNSAADQAIGANATANGTLSFVDNTVTTDIPQGGAYAIGTDILVEGASSVGIGRRIVVKSPNVYAMGMHLNVGTDSNNSVVLGIQNNIGNQAHHSNVMGSYNTIADKASSVVALGNNLNVSQNTQSPIVIGISTNVGTSSHNAIAMGTQAKVQDKASNAIAVGSGANVGENARQSIAIGTSAKVFDGTTSAVSIGDLSSVQGAAGIAIGNKALVSEGAKFGTTVGQFAKNDHAAAVVLGYNSKSAVPTAENEATVTGITYRGFKGEEKLKQLTSEARINNGLAEYLSVSVGAPEYERQIKNVAPGNISAESTDAINGSQLYLTQHALGNVAATTAKHLGGGSKVNRSGNLTAPVFNLTVANPTAGNATNPNSKLPVTANNVSAAFENLNNYVNQGFRVLDNDAVEKGVVTPGEAIQFVNGKNTVANVTKEADGVTKVTFDVNIDPNAGGPAVPPVQTTFKVKAGSTDELVNVNPENDAKTVEFKAGDHLSVSLDSNNGEPIVTYKVKTITEEAGTKIKPEGNVNKDEVPDHITTGKVVADMINNSGFRLHTEAKEGTLGAGSKTSPQLVKTGNLVKLQAGENIELTQSGANVKIAAKVANTTIAVNKATGDVTVPAANTADGNKLVNATTVAQAIKDSGFTATIGREDDAFVDQAGKASEVINPGDTLTLKAGKNMQIKQDGSNFVYATKDKVEFTEAKVGPININKDGSGKISGVTAGTEDNDAVNVSQLKDELGKHKWTINTDQTGSGEVSGNAATEVGKGDEVKFIAGDNVKITQDGKNITIEAKPQTPSTTNLAVTDNKVGDVADGDKNKLVTAENLKNTINDVAWEIQGNGEKVDDVKAGDKVNFANGTATQVTVEKDAGTNTNTVKVNVKTDGNTIKVEGDKITANTGDIKFGDQVDGGNGKVGVPDGQGNQLVNQTTVVNAINNASHKVATLNNDEQVTEGNHLEAGTDVKAGDKVNFIAGKNLLVKQVGKDITFSLAKDINVTSVVVGDNKTTINPNGTISNVTSNLPDTFNTDIVNKNNSPVTTNASLPNNINDVVNNAATVKDVLNSGWNLKNDGVAKDFVKPYDTVGFNKGGNTNAVVVTNDEGTVSNVSINVVGLPVQFTDKDGNVVAKVGDTFYKVDGKGNPIVNDENKVEAGDVVANAINPTANNITGAPISIGNVEGNLPNTYNKGDKEVQDKDGNATVSGGKPVGNPVDAPTKSQTKPDNADSIFNNVATVGDVLNAGFNLQENGTAKDFVKPYDTVNFVNGTNTVANVTTTDDGKVSNVTFNVDPSKLVGDITNNTNGTTNTTNNAGDNKLATTNTVVEAINKSGWNVTVGRDEKDFKDQAGNEKEDLINPGDKVTYQSGKNLKVKKETSADGKEVKFTYATEDDVVFNTVKVGNTNTTIHNNGTISNVTSNLPDTFNTDIVNKNNSPVTTNASLPNNINDVVNNAATVGDVLNAGWNLQNNGEAKDFVKPYDTVNFVNGGNTKHVVETDKNGKVSNVSVNVVGLPVQFTDENGNPVAKVGNTFYKVDKDGNPTKEEVPANKLTANAINPTAAGNETGTPIAIGNVVSNATLFKDGDIYPKGTNISNAYTSLIDPVNSAPNNVLTVGDIENIGWVVSTIGGGEGENAGNGYAAAVPHSHQVDFIGKGMVSVNGDIDPETGIHKVIIDVNTQGVVEEAQLPVVYTDKDGNKVYKAVNPDTNEVTFNTKPDGTGDIIKPADVIASMNNGNNNTTTPMVLTNVGSNLPNTYNTDAVNKGNEPVTKVQPLPEGVENKVNNAATVGDVLNAGFNLQENGTAKDFVKPYDTVNFVNGTHTVANVTTTDDGKVSNIKFDVDANSVRDAITGNVTNNENGTVKLGDQNGNNADGNKLATTGDVVNAINNSGWTIKGKDEAGKEVTKLVKPGSTVNFTDGNNTKVVTKVDKDGNPVVTVNVDGTSIVDAEKGDITVNNNGTVATKDGDDKKVATTSDVVNAINNSGWTATSGAVDGGVVEGTTEELINPGEKVTYQAGKNLKVKQEGNVFTYSTQDDVNFKTIELKDGDNVVNFNVSAPNTLNLGGDNNAPVTVTNVKGNLPDTYNKDAVNKGDNNVTTSQQLPEGVENKVNNVATVGDVLNAGWNLQNNGEAKDFVKPYDTVNFANSESANINVVTDKDGKVSTITVDVNATTLNNVLKGDISNNADGTVKLGDVNNGGKKDPNLLATTGDVTNAINNSGWNIGGKDENGKPVTQLVNPGKKVTFDDGNYTTAVTSVDQNGNPTVKVNVDGAKIVNDQKGNISYNDDGTVKLGDKDGNNTDGNKVATTGDVVNAINNSGWKATIGRDDSNFADQAGKVEQLVKPGEVVTFQAGQNLRVKQDGQNITYALQDNVVVDKVTVGKDGKDGSIGINGKDGASAQVTVEQGPKGLAGNDGKDGESKTRIVYKKPDGSKEHVATLNDGLKFKGNDGKVVEKKLNETLTVRGDLPNNAPASSKNVRVDNENGELVVKIAESPKFGNITINDKGRISGVERGVDGKDAVNVAQLKDEIGKATAPIHNKINRNNKDLRAGIAGANAAAGLPQVYIPGKSMVAAAAGTFKGQSAVAVGYSRASDNGKLLLKLQGNANTRGDFGGSVGIGYQW